MSTQKAMGTTKYRTVPQGKTQRATAESVYAHLQDHPKDIPDGKSISRLAFRLQGAGAACIQFCDYNGLNLSVFPATTTEIQVEHGWAANSGDSIGRGALIGNPQGMAPGSRDENIRLIRIVIGRTLRHHAKEDARVAAQIERRQEAEAHLTPIT